ncbi:uncharacterized protein TRIADDRAFT_59383 [Trichoplax adhaerens]|uniref:SCP2 domain-containing protein n=1 Tax=Trichoplax adhaerens TaxID=10228 RepID=B3S4X6_TRIAD|nr:predicted protein [Trichoplax adhaerens]EDV22283.1 predicted protein [Trichoplax adhaerens]|eukprot:XP_002115438.1 predicted protein [Trichoplax adhaerens]
MDNLTRDPSISLYLLDDREKDQLRVFSLKSANYPRLELCTTSDQISADQAPLDQAPPDQSLTSELQQIVNSQKENLVKAVDGVICFQVISTVDQQLKYSWVLDLKQGEFRDGKDENADCTITFTSKKPEKIQSGQWRDRLLYDSLILNLCLGLQKCVAYFKKSILKSSWNITGDESVFRRLLRVLINNRFNMPSFLSGFLTDFFGVIIKLKIKSKL